MKGKDASILRSLAGQVAEIAARPLEEEKRKLWFAHNALEKVRPLVFCDPENGWNEIFPKESLLCEDPLMRQWEMRLRKEIFWGTQMNDDRVIEPYFYIGYVYKRSNWGMEEVREGGGNGGSYRWKAPLTDFKDMDKLRFPTLDQFCRNRAAGRFGKRTLWRFIKSKCAEAGFGRWELSVPLSIYVDWSRFSTTYTIIPTS